MNISKLLTAPAFAAMLAFSGVAGATLIIDNSASINNAVQPFGAPNTATYGEAFHTNATDTLLSTFSMFLNANGGGGTLDFKGYIGAWDGTKVTSIVYSSATQTATGAGGAFGFAPAVQLAANANYIAFLSISELAAQPDNTYTMPAAFGPSDVDPSTDGFFFQNNGLDESQWSSTAWDSFGAGVLDVRLIAELRAPDQVPEPGALALVGLAMAAMVATRKRVVAQH